MNVLSCLTVIMDMNDVGTETADLPSGSTRPWSPEAAAKVKTTSTAQGKNRVIHSKCEFIVSSVSVLCL